MSTTAKDIIQGGFARSTANDPEKLATKKELIPVLSDFLAGIYADVAKINPFYFGASSPVTGVAGVWTRPANLILIFRVENAAGGEVYRVPLRQRDGEIPPRIYPLGRNFRTVGLAGDPGTTDVLTFYGSIRHPALDPTAAWDAAANTLDASWPVQHNELLKVRIGRYLADKDSRAEAGPLKAEEDRLRALLIEEASLDDYGEHRSWEEDPS